MMGLFEQLRDNISRGLGALQGRRPQPVAAPQPTQVAAQVAAQPDSPWVTAWLDEEDFTAAGLPYRANEWFSLAQFRVPEDRQVQVRAGERRIRMYLKGLAVRAGSNYGAPTNRNVVVPNLVQTKQAAPTLPSLFHPEVAVWANVGGVWTKCPVVAINYGTGTITFEEPAGVTGTDAVEIYYTHGDGQFRFRVLRELGGVDDAAATTFNGSFSALHTLEQSNLETMWAWPNAVNLVPGMRVSLEVYTASVPMVWNSRAGHYLHIYAESRRLNIMDRSRLVKMAELAARNNL
ncbi:hypothetical protein [Meiothermus sp.]|uniref:hypothetical protein n=1 Tax=Meiothermus sp. TaxID=1955249 RepID=UPI00307E8030